MVEENIDQKTADRRTELIEGTNTLAPINGNLAIAGKIP